RPRRPFLGPARRAYLRRGLRRVAQNAEAAPLRLFQGFLRRHGPGRQPRRNPLRNRVLRRRPCAVRLRLSVRSGEGAGLYPGDDGGHAIARSRCRGQGQDLPSQCRTPIWPGGDSMKKHLWLIVVILAALVAPPAFAKYPDSAIRILVSIPPGGA